MRIALIVLMTAAAAILGFGYWHACTHGTLHVYLDDIAHPQQRGPVYGSTLHFHDASGKQLARAKSDNRWGVVWPQHPVAGYCGPDLTGDAYHACFKVQSAWLMEWVSLARYADIQVGACHIRNIPVTAVVHSDSILLWWLPLPHVGGLPRTNYSFSIAIDSRDCRAVQR